MENYAPIGATHDDADRDQAIRGACDTLKSLLATRIGQLRGYRPPCSCPDLKAAGSPAGAPAARHPCP